MARRPIARGLDLENYHRLTRGVTVSVAYLLPLLAAYEVGVWRSGMLLRNSAEVSLKRAAGLFGGAGVWVELATFLLVAVVAVVLARRNVPAIRLYPVFLLEALLFALLLGPVVSFVVGGVGLRPAAVASRSELLLLSIGAGVYEELLFRLFFLAGSFAVLHRVFGTPRAVALGAAIVSSALCFAGYHYVGRQADVFRWSSFAFRAIAGLTLGGLFSWRGLALCAYLHAFYDIFCDLDSGAPA